MATILLVEDDERISEPLLRVLSTEGFDVIHAPTGNAGLDAVATGKPNLVLLDLTLPDIDGLDVCRRIRDDRPELPVIMLTAHGADVDRIVGLELGADDYLPKPFNPRELVARVRAVLRRTRPNAERPARDVGETGVAGELRSVQPRLLAPGQRVGHRRDRHLPSAKRMHYEGRSTSGNALMSTPARTSSING